MIPKNPTVRIVVKTAVFLVCFLGIFTISELLGGQHLWSLFISNPIAFLYGFCIILALWALFFALTGSATWSLRITNILVLLYSLFNYFTLLFRGSPFIPQDIFGLGTATDVASSYSLVFSGELAAALLITLGIFLLAPWLRRLSKKVLLAPGETASEEEALVQQLMASPSTQAKRERDAVKRKRKRYRWILRLAALVASVVFFCLTVSKPFIVALDLEPFYFEQWQSARQNGSLVNFVANIADSGSQAPEAYSPEAVAAIAAQFISDSASDATIKPDVIVILGESWADITPTGLVKTNQPVMPFISSFQYRQDTSYGQLIVSSKGGGTSRQEFQFLTGANDVYGLHTAPFIFLVDEQLPNIVRSFNEMGYETIALHTGVGSAWNRNTALPAMGFDEFITEAELWSAEAPTLRTYLRDSVMYDKILELLDNAEGPAFLYGISIQTHGGYTYDDFTSTIRISQPEGSYTQTEQFLTLMNESDKDFEAFISALEERKRPTLVLFFGDHLPNFDNTYYEDVFDGSNPLWRYQAIYGAWANYKIPEITFAEDTPLSLSYLNLYLMQAAGLPQTGYQKFLTTGAKEFPVSSIVGFVCEGGTLISVEEARQTEVFKQQAIMQYCLVYDRSAIPEEFFFLQQ